MKNLLYSLIGWVILAAAIFGFLAFMGSISGPRSDTDGRAARQSVTDDTYDFAKEATWAALSDQESDYREDRATMQAEQLEERRAYDDARQEEADRAALDGAVREAVRCSRPGAENC